ncbi:MAG: SDR family NAD(P)-dependent oxidoreductase, partial [Myxococcales bacterium]|nr:SDR family NAD(P)-dependent oxidoreductase [Myxococcales bacterium]
AKVVEGIRQQTERVDVLLHGAGVERSRQLADKPPEEFDLVFDVKCDGWFHLLHALGDVPVGAVIFFSSISGRFGNAGQTDYSAANDLLCKLASSWRSARPDARAVALDWTAWADIGMASRGSIPQVMASAGIDMLDPQAGIPMVRRVLQEGFGSGELLVAEALGVMLAERDATGGLDPAQVDTSRAGPLIGEVTGMSLAHGLHVVTRLEPGTQPFLDHHRIDGTAVLPGVMGVEAFAEAARLLHPDRPVLAVEDVAFLAPFKFYRDEPRELEIRCRLREEGDEIVADCALRGSRLLAGREAPQETLHFRGRVRLGAADASPGAAGASLGTVEPAPASGERVLSADDLYRVYFHGPAYQVLGRAWRAGDRVVGAFADGLPAAHTPPDLPLATRPRLLELCFQTLGAWEIAATQRMALPEGFARVRFAGDGEIAAACAVVRVSGEAADAVEVVDADGRVLVRLEGYRTSVVPQSLPEALVAPLVAALAGGRS